MKLLISVANLEEASIVLENGCDIIDIKNPKEGSLGANHPKVIKEIIKYVDGRIETSATIGDLPYLPGTSSLAGLGAAMLGVDYVKAGLYGVINYEDAYTLAKWIVSAVKEYYPKTKVIICGYGDYLSIKSVNLLFLPKIAYKVEADGVLIDLKTKSKNTNIFRYLDPSTIRKIVKEVHEYNMIFALAGGLNITHVNLLKNLNVDVMGVRRGVLHLNNWLYGSISGKKVRELYEKVHADY